MPSTHCWLRYLNLQLSIGEIECWYLKRWMTWLKLEQFLICHKALLWSGILLITLLKITSLLHLLDLRELPHLPSRIRQLHKEQRNKWIPPHHHAMPNSSEYSILAIQLLLYILTCKFKFVTSNLNSNFSRNSLLILICMDRTDNYLIISLIIK